MPRSRMSASSSTAPGSGLMRSETGIDMARRMRRMVSASAGSPQRLRHPVMSISAGELIETLFSVEMARASSPGRRSEEHTSELQSQSNLVCRLLLEKKKRHAFHVVVAKKSGQSDQVCYLPIRPSDSELAALVHHQAVLLTSVLVAVKTWVLVTKSNL